jgi:RNA-directed DNA polymerase
MTHGRGKSDSAVVAGKSVNKAEQLAAESRGEAGAKGNVGRQAARRAQNGESVSLAPERRSEYGEQQSEGKGTVHLAPPPHQHRSPSARVL